MKIGIDCRIFSTNFTGIGRYTSELVDHFIRLNDQQQRKHELVLFFNNPEFRNYKAPNPAVKKVLVNAKHYSFAEQTRFLKALNKENCSVVHFPHFNVPIFYRKPYTVTIHDLTLSFFPGQKMNKFYHRIGYHLTIKNAVKRAKKVIAVSNNTKKDIIEQLRINPDKITTIYNGLSDSFRMLDNAKAPQKPFLLYTGVWRDHKNLVRLINAFAQIHKKLDIDLVITGKENPYYPEVKQAVESHSLQDHVLFPGHVSEKELLRLYNTAKIFVFPSLYEGFGLPPLEAMACGTPVAASNVSSIPEICGEKNAVFFDPYDENDIANKITSLYKDPDHQAELISLGLARAENFTWTKTAQKTYQLITHV